MIIVIDNDFDSKGNIATAHLFDTLHPGPILTIPGALPATGISAMAYLAWLQANKASHAAHGWEVVSKVPGANGKTRWQVLVDAINASGIAQLTALNLTY